MQTRREEILHVHYLTTPQHKNPCSGDNSIYNFGKLFLGHHYYTLNLSDLCLSEEKKILKEINAFSLLYKFVGSLTTSLYPHFVCSVHGSREEDFHRNNSFSLYNLYGHTLAQEPLPQRS